MSFTQGCVSAAPSTMSTMSARKQGGSYDSNGIATPSLSSTTSTSTSATTSTLLSVSLALEKEARQRAAINTLKHTLDGFLDDDAVLVDKSEPSALFGICEFK